jgi:hypothetical protein
MEMGKLSAQDAQLLTTPARVERAQSHLWRCSDNCVSHMRRDIIKAHINEHHPGGGQRAVRQMVKGGIIRHILGDEEHGRIGWADIQSMLGA